MISMPNIHYLKEISTMKLFTLRPLWTIIFGFVMMAHTQSQDYCENLFTDNEFASIQKLEMKYARASEPTGYIDSIDLYLDLYYSEENSQEVKPMMILLHGGSFITELGDKSGMEEISRLMVAKGFVVASIDYTTWSFLLGGTPTENEIVDVVVKAILDLQNAIEFVVAVNGQGEFPEVDVDNLVIGGGSAGAITALHRMYIDESDELPDFLASAFDNNGGLFESKSNDFRIAYGINLSGGIWDTAWIDPDEPPLISVHGDKDSTVYYDRGRANGFIDLYGSKPIDERLMSQGIDSYFYTFQGGRHSNIYGPEPLYREPLIQVLDTGLMRIHDQFCLRTNTNLDLQLADVQLINTLVQQDLRIVNRESVNLKYQVVDMWGRIVQSGELVRGPQRIAFRSSVSGYYALQVYNTGDQGRSRYQQLFYFNGG